MEVKLDIFISIIQIFLFLLSPFIAVFGLLMLNICLQVIYKVVVKKQRIPKRGTYKHGSFMHNIFIKFPSRVTNDIFDRQDYEFGEYGLHMVCGEQGSGKTTTVSFFT